MTSDDESIGDVANPELYASALEPEMDVPVYVKEGIHVEAFQTQILECKVDPLQEESAEVMVIPVRPGDPWRVKIKLLPPGLQVPLHVYCLETRQWQSLHSHVECLRVTHLPQEENPGCTFGACCTHTAKHACIGIRGSGTFGGHCRTPLHGGTAGEAS